MNIHTITVILSGIAASLAYLPYPWSRLAAGSIAAGIAALHGGYAVANRPSKGQRTP